MPLKCQEGDSDEGRQSCVTHSLIDIKHVFFRCYFHQFFPPLLEVLSICRSWCSRWDLIEDSMSCLRCSENTTWPMAWTWLFASENGLRISFTCHVETMQFFGVTTCLEVTWYLLIPHPRCEVPKGALVGVVGATGAGKSSLLQALLGRETIRSCDVAKLGMFSGRKLNLRPQLLHELWWVFQSASNPRPCSSDCLPKMSQREVYPCNMRYGSDKSLVTLHHI